MDIDIARATDKELDALYEARTTALEGALIKALLSERSYSREGWGRAATNSGIAYERGQLADARQAEVDRLKAEVGRLFGLKETYSTAAFNLQAQLRDAELQAETLRAEVERLKVEEADTRNSYTALKHSAGDVLVRAEAAELQITLWREYHAFLNKAMEGAISLAWAHGWRCPERDSEKGAAYRVRLRIPDDDAAKQGEPAQKRQCIECGHDDVNLGWCGARPAPFDKLHCRKCCTIPACWKKA